MPGSRFPIRPEPTWQAGALQTAIEASFVLESNLDRVHPQDFAKLDQRTFVARIRR